MIEEQDIVEVAKILKPHGIKGEINVELEYDIDLKEFRCIVLDVDSIYVPFFIDGLRDKSSTTILLHIDGIDTEEAAREICGKSIYLLRNEMQSLGYFDETMDDTDSLYASDLIGYKVVSEESTSIGEIIDFDDSTENVLLIVRDDKESEKLTYIPFVSEFIVEVDSESKILNVDLPEGILNL